MTDGDTWLLVDLTGDPETAGYVSAALWDCGVAAIEEIDNPDGTVTLRTSLGIDSGETVVAIVAANPGVSVRPVEIPREVADTWRRFVSPSHVADDVWLVPAWCERPDGRSILIEPFDTFGLGNHPTTVLTLREALRLCVDTTRVLDVGCGSGVLAVAVARLCGSTVDAYDIAPQAQAALRHNAELNGVEGLVTWCEPLGTDTVREYDVVLANILAPVLRSLASDIVAATRPGGVVVLSGLREEQVDGVVAHFDGCSETHRAGMEGWGAVVLRRDR